MLDQIAGLVIGFLCPPILAIRSAISLLLQRDALPTVAPPHLHAVLLYKMEKVKGKDPQFSDLSRFCYGQQTKS